MIGTHVSRFLAPRFGFCRILHKNAVVGRCLFQKPGAKDRGTKVPKSVKHDKQRMGTAARLYVSFLQNNPDYPDAPGLWRKACIAFDHAGHLTQAIWAQEEFIRRHPQLANFQALLQLAQLKGRQKPEEAISLIVKAIGVATSAEDKAEAIFWRARFINDSQGPKAGITAFDEAERDIRAMGLESKAETCRRWIEGTALKSERDQKAGVR